MVEIGAKDFRAVGIEGQIAPDRAPEACAVAGDHIDVLSVFFEHIDRKRRVSVLDILVLKLQVVLEFDAGDLGLEFAGLVAFGVNQEGGLDVLAVHGQNLVVAKFGKVFLAREARGRKHLADGLRLDVGLLLGLERHRRDGQDGGRYDDDERRVDNRIYVAVGIHG